MDNKIYVISTKYKYEDDKQVVRPGDIYLKEKANQIGVTGVEVTLKELGKLHFEVEEMLYNFSNQWVDGMDVVDFIKDVTGVMSKINRKNLIDFVSSR